jgi:hypothetical protein
VYPISITSFFILPLYYILEMRILDVGKAIVAPGVFGFEL